ncbi:MAG: hypothetical protein GYB55_10335 [Cytophagales bacterium]|uniref:DUF6702 family protein n=1 Tax=Cyclobacterium marinum TaxID=104 RepID=UPI0030DBF2BB|nr:hypothetical protein [Cytophagales bacterium]|tara:strand:+ start:5146 stop:5796 length:651 start_codon:yes stop_codon:yes gene_type:complete
MKRWIVSLVLVAWASLAQAHQPAISTVILAEKSDQSWILQIRSPLTSFEYVIIQNYGENSFASADEFKDLVINYLKENISIRFNGNYELLLQKGTVKLGHETNVFFQVTEVPEKINSLEVSNTSFKTINRNQSMFMVLGEGLEKDQFILNNENEHSAILKVDDNKLVQQEATLFLGLFQKETLNSSFNIWVLGVILALALIYSLQRMNIVPAKKSN